VYSYFGLPLTAAAVDAMRGLASSGATGAAGGHSYALEDFGLSVEEVDARFGALELR
jgi:hypothetical protein